MNWKIVFAITGFVLLGEREISAQIYSYPEQALSLTRIQPGGTARIRAMGGVQTALGGDLSSAYYNPGGLGMYNRSDFAFTPGYTVANSSANYLGTTTDTNKTSLIVPNFGVAFHTSKDGSKGLWGGTFAINFNRINDFNNSYSYHGTNQANSIIDYFISAANGTDISQFQKGTNSTPEGFNYNTPVGLAFNNYLIGPASELNPSNPKDQYFSYVPLQDIIQDETIKTSGAQNQWSFSYGVNFNDKIFVGGGLGLATLSYKTSVVYNETYAINPLKSMQLKENFEMSGNGVNLTLGMIARPLDQLQLGFSLATPTSYQINENYNATVSSNWNNFNYPVTPPLTSPLTKQSESTDNVINSYSLSTPWRFSGGMAFFIEKHGFISADVEYLSYGASHYSGKSGSDQDNKDIKNLYKSVLNIRVGGEYRLNSYRFRAGYNFMPDPYQSPQNGVDRSISSYTAGFGYRQEKYYIDLALVYQQGNSTHSPYSNSPNVTLANAATSVIFTIGFPF